VATEMLLVRNLINWHNTDMGGNALKQLGIESRRIATSELWRISSEIRDALSGSFHEVSPVLFYANKPDHGDIDLVGHVRADCKDWKAACLGVLSPKAHSVNDGVMSLEYDGVQVDLSGHLEGMAYRDKLNFCGYSPIGNVLGRMIKQTGAKWGMDGLTYPVRETVDGQGDVLGEVRLSGDLSRTLHLAGLPLDYPDSISDFPDGVSRQGFRDQESIFRFSVQSPLFSKEIFQFENLNHVNRKRDRTRKDYHAWLTFIESDSVVDRYKRYSSDEERTKAKEMWFDVLCDMFPESNLRSRAAGFRENLDIRRATATKFNGQTVAELTGLTGKALGGLFKKFQTHLGGEAAFVNWRIKVTPDEARQTFLGILPQLLSESGNEPTPGVLSAKGAVRSAAEPQPGRAIS